MCSTSRLPLRVETITACAIALPLYAAEEIVSRLRGRQWYIPATDHVDDWLSELDSRIEAAGDGQFGERLVAASVRIGAGVDAVLDGAIGPRVQGWPDE